jgi:hypothetical protein
VEPSDGAVRGAEIEADGSLSHKGRVGLKLPKQIASFSTPGSRGSLWRASGSCGGSG